MVRPAARRLWVQWVREAFQVSTRRACRATGVWRTGVLYRSRRPSQEPLRRRLRELACVRVSYGQKRLHVLLRREGWAINHKRTRRLYREEGLQLGRRRGPSGGST
jgi:putative transposase